MLAQCRARITLAVRDVAKGERAAGGDRQDLPGGSYVRPDGFPEPHVTGRG